MVRLAWWRSCWWVWRTVLAAAATGLAFGTLVGLPFALAPGAPPTFMLLAWGIGGAVGGAAGLIAGLMGAGTATIVSPRRSLGRRGAVMIGAIACTVGSLAILIPAYDFGPDPNERPFVVLVTAVAAVVGGAISPGTERRAGQSIGNRRA